MNITEKLVEQHIREYESRLKHVNELFDKAAKVSGGLDQGHELHGELKQFRKQHDNIANHADELKKIPFAHWREDMIRNSGPMGILDILAQKLEDVIERLDR
jgi:hypothetical protein